VIFMDLILTGSILYFYIFWETAGCHQYTHNLNNVKYETNRYFRNKKREYMKDKINEFKANKKIKNIRPFNICLH
jgi:predicted NAD-dependent protein-ADP-ribosyltransferase YbiA (DUF1768 family)